MMAKAPTATTVISPTVRASLPLAAAPSRARRLARTRTKTRVIGVTTPSSTWVLMIRVKRLPGDQHHPGADDELGGEQAEEERGLAEGLGHRPLDAHRLGHRVGGGQGHHRGGQGRGPQQADAEEVSAKRPATGSRALAASAAELQRTGAADDRGGGDDDAHRHEVGEDRPAHRVDPLVLVLLGTDAPVDHGPGRVQLDVGGDGGADRGPRPPTGRPWTR